MKRWESVTIIGAGLIGASIGLALRERRLAKHVVAVGRRASSLRKAKDCGAATATTTNLKRGVANAELIIVCTPVELIVQRVAYPDDGPPRGGHSCYFHSNGQFGLRGGRDEGGTPVPRGFSR